MARTIHEKADVVPLLAEAFREFGYEGASLGLITQRTGLGKGSLYHFFPGGKVEMAAAVLEHVDQWFEAEVFAPLENEEPRAAIARMWRSVDNYFHSGRRICLVGAFALDGVRDRFASAIKGYFVRWIVSLGRAYVRAGKSVATARERAETAIAGIQGALVLARALDDPAVFSRSIERLAREDAVLAQSQNRARIDKPS